MRLHHRILLPSFLLLTALLAGGAAFYLDQTAQEAALRAEAERMAQATTLAGTLDLDAAAILFNLFSYRNNRRQAHLDEIIRLDRTTALALDAYAPLAADDGERALLGRYIDSRNQILALRMDLVRAIQSSDETRIQPAYARWALQRAEVDAHRQDLTGYRTRGFADGAPSGKVTLVRETERDVQAGLLLDAPAKTARPPRRSRAAGAGGGNARPPLPPRGGGSKAVT